MDRKLRKLTTAQLEAWDRDGCIVPVRVFDADEAARHRASLEAFERVLGTPLMEHPGMPRIFSKSHLLFTWVDAIVRHPAVLDAVEDLVGPDLRVFHNNVFVKEPHSPTFVSWHQDGAYNAVLPAEVVTTWVALSESSPATGCVRILKGSHRRGLRTHVDRKSPDNILSRGQRIENLEDADVIDLTLAPGEMSMHHTHAVHASEPNRSDRRRIGVMTTYVPTRCRYAGTGPARMRAALVRGTDRYGHFDDEPRPVTDFGEAERAAHRLCCELYIANVTASENRQLAGAA